MKNCQIIKFPITTTMINREMDRILEESKRLEGWSKELLNYAIRNIPTDRRRNMGLSEKETRPDSMD